MTSPSVDSPLHREPTENTIILSTTPPNEPPPPYPSRTRRNRRRRILAVETTHLQVPSTSADSDHERSQLHSFAESEDEHGYSATETTHLLSNPGSPRIPQTGRVRQRTLSLTSTTSVAPSFAQTVLSAFNPERDCDIDSDYEGHDNRSSRRSEPSPTEPFDVESEPLLPSPSGIRHRRSFVDSLKRYFRPMGKKAYYSALFHLLVVNFPFALVAWVYLFVFTLTGTTTLMALPLGAVLCFLDLIGARAFSRGELALQTTFHGPLAFPSPYPPHPIFTRIRPSTAEEIEAGLGTQYEHSFYRNAYSMFTDPTSYQALFYFLVIKPGITLFLSLIFIVLAPVSLALILPFPAVLRLVRRLGIWQANVAVDGLYYTVR